MDDAEVDDFHRVAVHHEQVARLEVAVDQPLAVRGLQAAASLAEYLDRPFDGEPLAGRFDQVIQRRARQ